MLATVDGNVSLLIRAAAITRLSNESVKKVIITNCFGSCFIISIRNMSKICWF